MYKLFVKSIVYVNNLYVLDYPGEYHYKYLAINNPMFTFILVFIVIVHVLVINTSCEYAS
jgi:hypothetical protein